MKVIQSFWTKPIKDDPEKIQANKILYTLSLQTLKNTFQEVELITDSLGKEILKDLNYDKVSLHLDDNYFQELDPLFWSAAKILPLEKYNEPTIHFDGDFFIFMPEKFNTINQTFDVIVQSRENAWESNYKKQLVIFKNILKSDIMYYTDYYYNFSYNCGILGFKNLQFRSLYIEKYKNILNESLKNVEALKIAQKLHFGFTNVNCFLEQVVLTQTAQNKNIYVKEFIQKSDFLHKPMICPNFKNVFFHAIGTNKFDPKFIKAVEKVININKTSYKPENIRYLINFNRL